MPKIKVMNEQMNLMMITPKEKARLFQLFEKTINDPDLDKVTLNKIKNAIVSKNLKTKTTDSDKGRSDVLDKYAEKFNLPRTIQKYLDGSSSKPQFKFQLAKLLKDSQNLITKEKLENEVEGSLLDLVSPSIKNNPLFREITDYLLTFRARGKGVGEAWLLNFGSNPNVTEVGDVSIDGYNLELKDGEGLFSIDSKLGRNNKYIQDTLNNAFFSAFNVSGGDFKTLDKTRKKKADSLNKLRHQLKTLKQYVEKGGRKPNKKSIPSNEDIERYSNLNLQELDKLDISRGKYSISNSDILSVTGIQKRKKPTQGYGLDYTRPTINKFLLNQKRTNPELLKKELNKYYQTLYKGSSVSIDELVKYIYDSIGNRNKIVKAISTFILKQYFNKEGFDVLMIVNPKNFKYRILTRNFILSLAYGDDLPEDLTYEPKFKRGGDAQNLADGWVNMGFK